MWPRPRRYPGLLCLAACTVTAEDIETWKETQHGPSKIQTAVGDSKLDAEVRVLAVLAMAELGLLSELDEELGALPPAEATALADGAGTRLVQIMRGGNLKAPATRVQVQAKDVLFALRDKMSPAERAKADAALAEWLAADVGERMQQGRHSAEKILTTLGAAAGPALAGALGPETLDLVEPAGLLRKIGDAAAVEAGARNLIGLAQSQRPAREATYQAMGRLGGPRIAAFLAQTAAGGEPLVRLWALAALALAADPSSVPAARAIAANATLPGEQRDYAFQVLQAVAATGDRPAAEALIGFVADANEKVRWRAIEALIATGRPEVVAALLDRMPTTLKYKPEDLRDFLENDIRKLGPAALPALRQALQSRNWVARLVAVHLLGELGGRDDLPGLEKLLTDGTPLPGWPGGARLADEAKVAVEKLRSRGG